MSVRTPAFLYRVIITAPGLATASDRRAGAFGETPGRVGETRNPLGEAGRFRAVGGAVAHAADDALQDAGGAEEIVAGIPVEVGDPIAAGQPAIDVDAFVEARHAQRFEVA